MKTMSTSDYIRCYLGGHEGTERCTACSYGWKTGDGYFVCMPKNLLTSALIELEAREKAMTLIADVACDYDGYRSVESLMGLIDELREIALKGAPS